MTSSGPALPQPPSGIDRGKRAALLLGLLLQLALIAAALWPAAVLVLHLGPRARWAWQWVLLILGAVLAFNYVYLAALLVLRLLIPVPREGFYEIRAGQRPAPQVVVFMLNVLLAKMRYETPWASLFSAPLTRLWPLGPLYRRYFGPHTPSLTLGDTFTCVDPWYLYAGRNVQFGGRCMIICHHFDNRGLYIRRVRIGDEAVIGGEALIMAGVEIGQHAVVAARALLPPDTKIGPYELWAGSPAQFVKSLAPAPPAGTDDRV